MTKAAQLFGKRLQDFLDNKETCEYIAELGRVNHANQRELIQAARGRNGGTYGHPKLAVFFARWLDVGFSVWCDAVIEDILTKKADLTVTQPKASAVVAVSQAGVGLDMASQLAQAVLQSVLSPWILRS